MYFCKNLKMKNICVFCGSSIGSDKRYAEAAERLGDVLADNDCTLYYGGGSVGLMNVIANCMIERGKKVIGVMPEFLLSHEIGHPNITKMISTKTMAERKDILMRESDAFIAMPGGFGTLDEITEVVVADQLRLMDKPMALYNTLGYFDGFITWIERGIKDGFVRSEHHKNLIITDNPHELLEKMKNYNPLKIEKWIKDIISEKV